MAGLAAVAEGDSEAACRKLVQGKRLHARLVAIAAALTIWFIMRAQRRATMRAVGHNRARTLPRHAVDGVLLKTALLSADWRSRRRQQVAGSKGNLTLDLSPGFGTAASCAMLAMPSARRDRGGDLRRGMFGADAMSRSADVLTSSRT
jgi:simple sugar transport system permease protein